MEPARAHRTVLMGCGGISDSSLLHRLSAAPTRDGAPCSVLVARHPAQRQEVIQSLSGEDIMQTCNRWRPGCWPVAFALVLAGCGQGEAPKAPSGAPAAATSATPKAGAPAVLEPAAVAESPAVQPAAK